MNYEKRKQASPPSRVDSQSSGIARTISHGLHRDLPLPSAVKFVKEVPIPQQAVPDKRIQLPLKVPFVEYTFHNQEEESIDHKSTLKTRRPQDSRMHSSPGKKRRNL